MIGKDLLCLCWHGNRLHTYIWEELLHEGIVTVVQQAFQILELGVLWNGIGPVKVSPEVSAFSNQDSSQTILHQLSGKKTTSI